MQMLTQEGTPPFRTSFCDEYEGLLLRCQGALQKWTQRREEAWQMGLRGRVLGAELVRLQADFAKAYAILQKHVRECPLCEFVERLACENAETPDEVLAHQVRPA
jgi:hypothetical protein